MKPLKSVKRSLAAISIIAMVSVLVACSARSGQIESNAGGYLGSSASPDFDMATESAAPQTEEMAVDGGLVEGISRAEVAIIKTGSMRLQVDDPQQSLDAAEDIVKGLGGSVENRYVYESDDGQWVDTNVQLKVPSGEFDKTFEQLAELGKVLEDQRSDIDVTLERADLRARVEALEISIDRLLALLKDASETSDLLQIETALAERQQELDSIKAQLTVLEDQVSFSRISVSFSIDQAIPGGPNTFWEGLVLGIDSIAKTASALVVIAGVALPWLVSIGVIALVVVWIIVRSIKRRKAKE